MNFFSRGCAVLFLCACAVAGAQVTLNVQLTTLPDAGAIALEATQLHDVVRVRAAADSGSGIARAVFEVDDQFRLELKKPPFVLDWDTLEENDGAHTVSVTAYNQKGQTSSQRCKVRVDNQLNLGVKHFVEVGWTALRADDKTALHNAARKALKISRVDVDALRLNALDAALQGDPNRGFQILEDQNNHIPANEPTTLRVRGLLLLLRALNAGDTRAQAADLQAGFPLLKKQAADLLALEKPQTNGTNAPFADALAIGDSAFALNKWNDALTAWQTAQSRAKTPAETRRAELRTALALLKMQRLQESEEAAAKLAHAPGATPTCAALLGAVQFHKRQYRLAYRSAAEAAARHNPAGLIVAALASSALNAGGEAFANARQAVQAADCAETQYTLMAALADTGQLPDAKRAFRLTLLRSPLFTPALNERGFEIVAYEPGEQWAQSLALFEAVLAAEPDNTSALAGRAACLIALHRSKGAQQQLVRLAALDPSSADLVMLRMAATPVPVSAQSRVALAAIAQARALDPDNYPDTFMPDMSSQARRLVRLRRIVPLTPFLLDLSEGVNGVNKTVMENSH